MFCIFLLLLSASSANEIVKLSNLSVSDNILCRGCGTHILTSDTIISKFSDASLHSFNDTIFDRKEVLVQLLVKDILFQYPVITSSDSSCQVQGDWEDDDLWFPDYSVRPCFCPTCGAFVGWAFQNDSPTIVNSADHFFGLILSNLIGENFLHSLVNYPNILI